MIRDRLQGRHDGKSGQSLVLFAICLPLMLLFVAFVVDAGHAFVDQRHLQNAADAASLAAAQDLSNGTPCGATCGATAASYVVQNGFPVGGSGLPQCGAVSQNCYQWPYVDSAGVSHPEQVLVKLYNCTPTYFGVLPGVPSQICESVKSIARTAALTQTTTYPAQTNTYVSVSTNVVNGTTVTTPVTVTVTTPASTSTIYNTTVSSNVSTGSTSANDNALFAADTSCSSQKGLWLGGNNVFITGNVHSNGNFQYDGNSHANITGGTYGKSACPPVLNNQIVNPPATLDSSYNVMPVPWPLPWNYSSVCPGSGYPANITLTSASPGGIYCATSSITSNGPPAGPATMVAPNVTINGNNQTLTGAYTDGSGHTLLAYATTGDLTITGNVNSFNGYLFAPGGTITIAKNNGANGFFEALDISIPFNDFTMTGTGPGGTQTPFTTTTYTSTTNSTTVTTPGTSSVSTGNSTSTSPPTTSYTTNTTSQTTAASTQVSTTGTTIGLSG